MAMLKICEGVCVLYLAEIYIMFCLIIVAHEPSWAPGCPLISHQSGLRQKSSSDQCGTVLQGEMLLFFQCVVFAHPSLVLYLTAVAYSEIKECGNNQHCNW